MSFIQFVEDLSTGGPELRKEFSELIASPKLNDTELCDFFKKNGYDGITSEECQKIFNAINGAGRGLVGGAVIQY